MTQKIMSEQIQILSQIINPSIVPEDIDWTFSCPLGDGERYIKYMRVFLTRIRSQIRRQRKVPRAWKLFVIKIENKPEENRTYVTIRKAMGIKDAMSVNQFNETWASMFLQDVGSKEVTEGN